MSAYGVQKWKGKPLVMFYCDSCRKEREWPDGYALSRGKCEVCGKVAVCYDIHHSLLKVPVPKDEEGNPPKKEDDNE
jgi:hypothetical protein